MHKKYSSKTTIHQLLFLHDRAIFHLRYHESCESTNPHDKSLMHYWQKELNDIDNEIIVRTKPDLKKGMNP